MNKEEKTQIFVKKLKIWGKNSGFSLKTQHGGSLRLLSGAPQPLKKKPGVVHTFPVDIDKKLKK